MGLQGGRCPSEVWLGSGQGHLGIEPVLTCGLFDETIVLHLGGGWRGKGERGWETRQDHLVLHFMDILGEEGIMLKEWGSGGGGGR